MIFLEKIKTKLQEGLSAVKARFARSETYTVVLPTIAACVFLLIFVPFLFNNSALQFQIEQKLSSALKANLEIDGKVEVALVPIPSITLNDVIIQNYVSDGKIHNFFAKKITARLSFLSSLTGDFAVDKVIIVGATLQSYNEGDKPEFDDELANVLEKKSQNTAQKKEVSGQISGKIFVDLFKIDQFNVDSFNSTNLPKFVIKNSAIVSYDKFSNKKEIKAINSEVAFSKKKIVAEGSFANQSIINNFKLYAKFGQKTYDESGKKNSYLELNSIYGNFRISGIFPDENLGLLKSKFRGVITGEILDLKSFYKSYVSRDGFIYNKINPSGKSIKIKASVLNQDDQILVSNIVINSNVISGRGDIAVDLSTKLPLIDIRMALENIDLDAVWLSEKEIVANENAAAAKIGEKTNDEKDGVKEDETKTDEKDKAKDDAKEEAKATDEDGPASLTLNLAKDIRNFDLTAEITVSRIKYLEEEIKNVNFYTTVSKQGEILILPLTLEVPGGGLFRMSGVLENAAVPKFIGSLDASGSKLSSIFKWLGIESQNLIYDNLKDYSLYADVMMIPNATTLNNVYLNINDGKSELLGEMRIHYTTKTSNILSNFRINNLVVDDYFLTSGQNIYLSPGSLLKKLLWLNNLSSNNDLSLSFDKLTYKNSVFTNQYLKARFGPGYIEVSQLKLTSDQIDMTASFAVDISGETPKFDMSIKAAQLVYNSTNNVADKPESADVSRVQQGSDLDNSADKAQDILANAKISLFDQFYALPSFEGFSGEIYLDLDNATFDNFNMANIKISGKLKDGICNIDKFTSDIYGGSLSYSGVVAFKFDKAISGNLTLEKIDLKPFLQDIVGIKNISGIANISAGIESLADNKKDFVKNLNSTTKFSAAGLTVENYGLNDLVKKMFNVGNYVSELRDPEKILFNTKAKTSIKQAAGTINFEKGRDNLFKISFETIAANGIASGKVDLVRNSLDSTVSVVFLTGNLKKQIPLNIATNLKGEFGNLRQSSNLNQVKQYLGLPYDKSEVEIAPAADDKKQDAPEDAAQKEEEKNQAMIIQDTINKVTNSANDPMSDSAKSEIAKSSVGQMTGVDSAVVTSKTKQQIEDDLKSKIMNPALIDGVQNSPNSQNSQGSQSFDSQGQNPDSNFNKN